MILLKTLKNLPPQANGARVLPFSPAGAEPRRWFTIKARGAKSAEVLIYGDIGSSFFSEGVSASDFSKELRALGKIDTLDVRISSYGGDVAEGLAIYRSLAAFNARKVVHIDSVAASIASIIAMAGDEIMIAEPAQIMIHDAWGFSMGNAADMRKYADHLETTSEQMAKVYVDRTNNAMKQVRAWMGEEKWFTSAEAVEFGFAQRVEENVKAAASASPAYNAAAYRYRNIPAALVAPAGTSSRPSDSDLEEAIRRRRDAHRVRQLRDRANTRS